MSEPDDDNQPEAANLSNHSVDATRRFNGGVESTEFGFLQASADPASLGKLAHYEILQVLGQGGFGVVFKAFDTKLRRSVAIKVIEPALASTSPARKRFLREARAAAAIRHGNVVQIYSVHEDPLPYLVMELINGQTLQQRSDASGPMLLDELLCIGQQIASGLSAAHKKDLLHRDIKPDNILIELGSDLKVKITDFGLARTVDDASITRSGSIAGTPLYMSPEQAMEQSVDQRSDLFSLGSVLYMLATGRPPFRASTTLAVLKRVADDTPRPISEIMPKTPAWLIAIIAKLHSKSRDERFQTADQVAQLLSQCLEQLREHGEVTAADQLLREYQGQEKSLKTNKTKSANQRSYVKATVLGSLLSVVLLLAWWFYPRSTSQLTSRTAPPGILTRPAAPRVAHAPFDAPSAASFQRAWSQHLKVPVEFENSVGIRFRLIPPGSFMMGSSAEQLGNALREPNGLDWTSAIQSEGPQHAVSLTKPFYISHCEITQQEYLRVMGFNPSIYPFGTQSENGETTFVSTQPVENVTWLNAIHFCNKLSELESQAVCYEIDGKNVAFRPEIGYRLPTEAEWEFACRAGTTTNFWAGDSEDEVADAGWTLAAGKSYPQPVGTLRANPFGLYDTIGNVLEWVEDSWEPDSYLRVTATPAIDPSNLTDKTDLRVAKGGCFIISANKCRSSLRRQRGLHLKNERLGFRIALAIEDSQAPGNALPK